MLSRRGGGDTTIARHKPRGKTLYYNYVGHSCDGSFLRARELTLIYVKEIQNSKRVEWGSFFTDILRSIYF